MLIYSISKEKELANIPKWVEWIELRVDLSPILISHLKNLSSYKVIITDRWNREGGRSKRSLKEKIDFYHTLTDYANIYFDLEIDLLEASNSLPLASSRVILSYHSFGAVEFSGIAERLQKGDSFNPLFIKIAQVCYKLVDIGKIKAIIDRYEKKILWLVMGKYGKLQRLLHSYLGSLGTFVVAPGEETVIGQLTLEDVEKYQHLLSEKPFKWGGIIGGEQVYGSLGLDYYNNYFKDNNIDASYLPIHLEVFDLDFFFVLIKQHDKLDKLCYGFSLTMPFKQEIPKRYSHSKISNLLIYDSGYHFYNTDADAFVKIKRRIENLPIKSILIYGTGSMAELALDIFSDYQIYLTGRNKSRLLQLKSKRKNIEVIDQKSPEIYFDLLINTSPLGMKGESFSRETGISKFRFVIDLPYSQDEIPLQQEVEKERYFSGREFWLYQSERQLQLFKERIENDKKQSFTK